MMTFMFQRCVCVCDRNALSTFITLLVAHDNLTAVMKATNIVFGHKHCRGSKTLVL